MEEWKLEKEDLKRADSIHYNSIVIDMMLTTNLAYPSQVINGKNALERIIKIGGITAAIQTISADENRSFKEALKEMIKLYNLANQKSDKVMIVKKSSDIEKAKEEKKIGLIMGFQGCDCLENEWILNLPVLHYMGARVMGLTYNERNLLGYGCTEPKDNGLTACGAQVVRTMNQLGIIIDLSHVGQNTAMDAIELSEYPVILTHSNVNAISPHVRNVSDDLIKALAKKGGLVGIAAWAPICARKGKEGTLTDYLDHLDYIVNLVGIDHAGIGADLNENMRVMPIKSDFEVRYRYMLKGFENIAAPGLKGFYQPHEIINVTRGLVARGYSEEEIRKILGGNFMKIANKVWDKN